MPPASKPSKESCCPTRSASPSAQGGSSTATCDYLPLLPTPANVVSATKAMLREEQPFSVTKQVMH